MAIETSNNAIPVEVKISVDNRSAFILGTVMFVAIVAAYFTIKSLMRSNTT